MIIAAKMESTNESICEYQAAEREAKDREARLIAEAAEKARIEAEEQVKYELEAAKRKEAELKLKNEKLLNEKRRSENVEHKRKINCEILEALSDLWIDEDTAKKIIDAIVKKEIPHIQINY